MRRGNKEQRPGGNAPWLWVQVADFPRGRPLPGSCGLCAAHYCRSLEKDGRLKGLQRRWWRWAGFIFRCLRSPRSPTHLPTAYLSFSKWAQMSIIAAEPLQLSSFILSLTLVFLQFVLPLQVSQRGEKNTKLWDSIICSKIKLKRLTLQSQPGNDSQSIILSFAMKWGARVCLPFLEEDSKTNKALVQVISMDDSTFILFFLAGLDFIYVKG